MKIKRKHISLKTKVASALLALNHIPYEDSKLMSADEICACYEFDHGVLHALGGEDAPWNLTPRLKAPHREKSKKDTAIVAKARRIDKKWGDFMRAMGEGKKPVRRPSKWPKRKFPSSVKSKD